MAAPHAEIVPILANLLPASFQLGFMIIRVVPVWPTRLLRGTKDPRHRFVRRQWLLATILFILSFLSCFYHLSHCSFLFLAIFSYLYVSQQKKCKGRRFKRFGAWNKDHVNDLYNFTRVILDVALKWELQQYWYSSRMRAIMCECDQHIIKRDDENEFFSAPERRKGKRRSSGELYA